MGARIGRKIRSATQRKKNLDWKLVSCAIGVFLSTALEDG